MSGELSRLAAFLTSSDAHALIRTCRGTLESNTESGGDIDHTEA